MAKLYNESKEFLFASAKKWTKCELITSNCLHKHFCTFKKAAMSVLMTLNSIACPTVDAKLFVGLYFRGEYNQRKLNPQNLNPPKIFTGVHTVRYPCARVCSLQSLRVCVVDVALLKYFRPVHQDRVHEHKGSRSPQTHPQGIALVSLLGFPTRETKATPAGKTKLYSAGVASQQCRRGIHERIASSKILYSMEPSAAMPSPRDLPGLNFRAAKITDLCV